LLARRSLGENLEIRTDSGPSGGFMPLWEREDAFDHNSTSGLIVTIQSLLEG